MRIAELALKLNRSHSDIIEILNYYGITNITLNTKLTEEQINKVVKNFSTVNTTNDISEINIIPEENYFLGIKQEIVYPGLAAFQSNFTDIEVKNLCDKIYNSQIRACNNNFLSNSGFLSFKKDDIDRDLIKYQLHFIAMKALKFYSGKLLTFIYKLPKFSSGFKNAKIYKSTKNWHENEIIDFPAYQFKIKDSNSLFYVTFLEVNLSHHSTHPYISIYNGHKRVISTYNNQGRLIHNYQEIIPQIILFELIKDSKITISSGYDYVNCDICNRPLKDAISIFLGRGPTCRENHPLIY